MTIHAGKGTNTQTDRYWGHSWYVWNNTGDRATLEDADGHVLDQCPYRGSSAGHTNCPATRTAERIAPSRERGPARPRSLPGSRADAGDVLVAQDACDETVTEFDVCGSLALESPYLIDSAEFARNAPIMPVRVTAAKGDETNDCRCHQGRRRRLRARIGRRLAVGPLSIANLRRAGPEAPWMHWVRKALKIMAYLHAPGHVT